MTYRISVPVGSGRVLTIIAGDPQELASAYASVGGDSDTLVAHIRLGIAEAEDKAVRTILSAANMLPLPDDASQPASEPLSPVVEPSRGIPEPADPWATPSDRPMALASSPAGNAPASAWPPAPAPAAAPAQGTITLSTPNGPQRWVLNPPNAPMCQHGKPAGYVEGTKAKGGTYKAFRCALGASETDWRSKCDFNQWI